MGLYELKRTRLRGGKELCNFSDSLVVEAPHSGFAPSKSLML
jgi:hypothetical protein